MAGVVATPIHARPGAIAGCSFAASSSSLGGPTYDAYSDDASLDAVGPPRQIAKGVTEAAERLEEILGVVLQAKVAMDKVGLVSPSKDVSRQLQERRVAWRS
eukprot:9203073-Pyramimonas_sp.AAC.1